LLLLGVGVVYFKEQLMLFFKKKPPVAGDDEFVGPVQTDVSVDISQPLGVRNNNLLNIKYSDGNNWQGQTGESSGFVVFESRAMGLRAAMKLLRRYYAGYGLKSVQTIIDRWAPDSENDTSGYAAFVAAELSMDVSSEIGNFLPLNEGVWIRMVVAMCKMENGEGHLEFNEVKSVYETFKNDINIIG